MLDLLDKKIEEKERRIRRMEAMASQLDKEREDLAAMLRTRTLLESDTPARTNGESSSSSSSKSAFFLPDEIDKVLSIEAPLHYTEIAKRVNSKGFTVSKEVVAASLSRYLGRRYQRTDVGIYDLLPAANGNGTALPFDKEGEDE